MGVAVLSPQDCLSRHHHHHRHLISPANKPRRTPNPNSNTSPNRSTRRRRNSNSPPPSSSSGSSPTKSSQPLEKSPPVMGQIRILKRGEDLSPPTKRRESEVPARTGPNPIPNGFYAGSAFVTSPAPSELPLPAFFTKRNCGFGETDQNQEIASELRRVLKLI